LANLYLGLDSSTQSLTALVIDAGAGRIVYEKSLNFEQVLAHCGTQSGVLPDPDPLVKHSPPLMWVEALEAIFGAMRADGVPLGEVRAVAGSGQQHGSVYLNDRAATALARLDPRRSLVDNLAGVFSRPTAPIWMDSSTTAECAEIRSALGGVTATAAATGSDTFERFTGPQIRKFARADPAAYAGTAHIALVSSFMASLLAGRLAPIDHGDGAGMNLMDIRRKSWLPAALAATAPGLERRLFPPVPSWQVIGPVAPYFTGKYGLNPAAMAVVWSGDNPCSLIGLGLLDEGMAAISLGTSYTYFGYLQECRTDDRGEGHVFGAPTGDYLNLICVQNGGLAGQRICDQYGLDWDRFGELLDRTAPGNGGGIMLPWFGPEIAPRVLRPGVHRFDLDENDPGANCRAIVEAQMMALRLHSAWMQTTPRRILATGGGSANRSILQIMADVMQCPVERIEVSKSAALGAALRAWHAHARHAGHEPEWPDITAVFCRPVPGSRIDPNPATAPTYDRLLAKYAACERQALDRLGA